MRKILFAFVVLCSLAALAVVQSYTPGTLAVSLSAVTSTGVGSVFAMPLNAQGQIPSKVTWQSLIAGGSATSISVNLECSLDNTSWFTSDTSTNIAGEGRSVSGPACRFVRCNVTAYNANGTNETCQFAASF